MPARHRLVRSERLRMCMELFHWTCSRNYQRLPAKDRDLVPVAVLQVALVYLAVLEVEQPTLKEFNRNNLNPGLDPPMDWG